ncbi:hypothetical protein ACFE04_027172 [Oxalis oulophora]
MARLLSKTLILRFPFKSSPPSISLIPSSHSLSFNRHRSSKPQIIKIDVSASSSSNSSSSSSSSAAEEEDNVEEAVLTLQKKLDDLFRMVHVQKSTPDWLPLLPGSSFWVPPYESNFTVVKKGDYQFNEADELFLATRRTWPSSHFFIDNNGTTTSEEVNVEVSGDDEEMDPKDSS